MWFNAHERHGRISSLKWFSSPINNFSIHRISCECFLKKNMLPSVLLKTDVGWERLTRSLTWVLLRSHFSRGLDGEMGTESQQSASPAFRQSQRRTWTRDNVIQTAHGKLTCDWHACCSPRHKKYDRSLFNIWVTIESTYINLEIVTFNL